MPKRLLTAATVILAATALPASATPAERGGDGPRFPINISAAETRMQERFAAMDTDGSDTISLAEFESAEGFKPHPGKPMRRRQHADKHPQARHPRHRGMHAERFEAHREAVQSEVFAILDSDGDGTVSAEEHAAANTHEVQKLARKRAMFKHLDADADGLLKFSELPDPAARLRAADSDGDGLVTRGEMRAHRSEQRTAKASGNG